MVAESAHARRVPPEWLASSTCSDVERGMDTIGSLGGRDRGGQRDGWTERVCRLSRDTCAHQGAQGRWHPSVPCGPRRHHAPAIPGLSRQDVVPRAPDEGASESARTPLVRRCPQRDHAWCGASWHATYPTHCVMERSGRCARLGTAYGCRFLALVRILTRYTTSVAAWITTASPPPSRATAPRHRRCARCPLTGPNRGHYASSA